jgi:hypothetical protein
MSNRFLSNDKFGEMPIDLMLNLDHWWNRNTSDPVFQIYGVWFGGGSPSKPPVGVAEVTVESSSYSKEKSCQTLLVKREAFYLYCKSQIWLRFQTVAIELYASLNSSRLRRHPDTRMGPRFSMKCSRVIIPNRLMIPPDTWCISTLHRSVDAEFSLEKEAVLPIDVSWNEASLSEETSRRLKKTRYSFLMWIQQSRFEVIDAAVLLFEPERCWEVWSASRLNEPSMPFWILSSKGRISKITRIELQSRCRVVWDPSRTRRIYQDDLLNVLIEKPSVWWSIQNSMIIVMLRRTSSWFSFRRPTTMRI